MTYTVWPTPTGLGEQYINKKVGKSYVGFCALAANKVIALDAVNNRIKATATVLSLEFVKKFYSPFILFALDYANWFFSCIMFK
jgi:hypothetical protein